MVRRFRIWPDRAAEDGGGHIMHSDSRRDYSIELPDFSSQRSSGSHYSAAAYDRERKDWTADGKTWPRCAGAKFNLGGYDAVAISDRANKSARSAVYRFAKYFRRELGFDFVQYADPKNRDDGPEKCQAFLFMFRKIAFGAAVFRFREWKDSAPCWSLAWIWMHPYFRGQGILKNAFPVFRERFGNFHIEHPLSSTMEGFLAKHGSQQPTLPEGRGFDS